MCKEEFNNMIDITNMSIEELKNVDLASNNFIPTKEKIEDSFCYEGYFGSPTY